VLEKNDPEGRIKLYLDEWGTWYDPAPGAIEGFLNQENTLRDAIVAAVNFNIFHRHIDRVHMANIAQTVNVLQAMILTDGAKMVKTPTYHAFKMHIPFQGATFLPVEMKKIPRYKSDGLNVPAALVTAARGLDGKIHLALVNLDPTRGAAISASLKGHPARAARGELLTAERMDARNTFDNPDSVQPRSVQYRVEGAVLNIELPPKSVMVLALE
jgi:alpha-N-arabinofuranosidase